MYKHQHLQLENRQLTGFDVNFVILSHIQTILNHKEFSKSKIFADLEELMFLINDSILEKQ